MMQNDESSVIDGRIVGAAKSEMSFGNLNMDFTMRIPSFIESCLSIVTESLNNHFDVYGLRGAGTALILYYFEAEPERYPLAISKPLEKSYSAQLFRAPVDAAAPVIAKSDRLVVDERFDLHGYARIGETNHLGYDEGIGERVHAGRVRMLQIFTRPLAPPGERAVTELPESFRKFREHPWEGPFPVLESLSADPTGFTPVDVAPPGEHFAVWGVGNTDFNQHVTVAEYLMDLENHFYLLLHQAGLPLRTHHVTRARCLFRKPFFPGMGYRVRGRLFRDGSHTKMHGGIYEVDRDGNSAQRPSVYGCYDGEIAAPGT